MGFGQAGAERCEGRFKVINWKQRKQRNPGKSDLPLLIVDSQIANYLRSMPFKLAYSRPCLPGITLPK